VQRKASGKEVSFQHLSSVFYTKESQIGDIIAAPLSLKKESKGKFEKKKKNQPLEWHIERPLKLEDWRYDSLSSILEGVNGGLKTELSPPSADTQVIA